MWRLNILLLSALLLISSCKSLYKIGGENESEEAKTAEETTSSEQDYYLPKVVEISLEDGVAIIKVRLHGKCDVHELEWMSLENCEFELRDKTLTDKCMGYQFVTEKMSLNGLCDGFVINGVSGP